MRRGSAPVVTGDEIMVGREHFALRDAAEIIAYEADIYAGHLLCLLLRFSEGRSVTVNQQDACWHELVELLDRLALTKSPSSEWIMAFLSGTKKDSLLLRGQ